MKDKYSDEDNNTYMIDKKIKLLLTSCESFNNFTSSTILIFILQYYCKKYIINKILFVLTALKVVYLLFK